MVCGASPVLSAAQNIAVVLTVTIYCSTVSVCVYRVLKEISAVTDVVVGVGVSSSTNGKNCRCSNSKMVLQ